VGLVRELLDTCGTGVRERTAHPADDLVDRLSTPGLFGSRYIRELEIPSSNSALRARSKGVSPAVRLLTARADAIPNDSL
jgi:hypothetical protein